jgi:hypothetical protein
MRKIIVFNPIKRAEKEANAFSLKVQRRYLVWLGWANQTKTVRKPQRGGVNFDPPMVFCACSMQNAPAASEMLQMSSYLV